MLSRIFNKKEYKAISTDDGEDLEDKELEDKEQEYKDDLQTYYQISKGLDTDEKLAVGDYIQLKRQLSVYGYDSHLYSGYGCVTATMKDDDDDALGKRFDIVIASINKHNVISVRGSDSRLFVKINPNDPNIPKILREFNEDICEYGNLTGSLVRLRKHCPHYKIAHIRSPYIVVNETNSYVSIAGKNINGVGYEETSIHKSLVTKV